jgi:HAD superfamily hydrolase (TIGR01509 family)
MNTPTTIRAIISDVSRTLLFPNNRSYNGLLNDLYKQLDPEKRELDFLQFYYFNDKLLSKLSEISKHIPCYIFTSGYLHQVPVVEQKFRSIFTKAFIAGELDFRKSDKNVYNTLATLIEIPIGEILFLDDASSNCRAAQEAGMQTILVDTDSDEYLSILSMFFAG